MKPKKQEEKSPEEQMLQLKAMAFDLKIDIEQKSQQYQSILRLMGTINDNNTKKEEKESKSEAKS